MQDQDLVALVTEARRAGIAAGYQEGVRDAYRRAAQECAVVQSKPFVARDIGHAKACDECAAAILALIGGRPHAEAGST